MNEFREVSPEELSDNPFRMIGRDWLLITAGDARKCNTMTASWGALGVLWGEPAATVYVRHTRYTLEFLDRCDTFSLSVLPEKYRPALSYCGSRSGRDGDKFLAAGLTPVFESGTPFPREAKTVLLCRKLYRQSFDPACFTDKSVDARIYPEKDYHIMFVGEIQKVLQAK